MRIAAPHNAAQALTGSLPGRRVVGARPGHRTPPRRRGPVLALGVLVALITAVALGALAPAALADGDPGSDVLVYQNLFVPADAGISVQQQVELESLLKSAAGSGFTIRVAVIAQRDDLGAVTALWRKPADYSRFLGIELSLAYKQRLLVVMPNGFGFNWPGHQPAAADGLLAKIPVGSGGTGLASSTEAAIRALASASGIQLQGTAGPRQSATGAASPVTALGARPVSGATGVPLLLLIAAVLAATAVMTLAGWLALRKTNRLRPPRLPEGLLRHLPEGLRRLPAMARRIPPAWLAGSLVIAGCAGIVLYAATSAPGSAQQAGAGTTTASSALEANTHLDPGTAMSGTAPGFTLTDQFGQPVSLSSYRGKVVILAFIDSECTTVCPMTSVSMLDAKAMLGTAGANVQLLGIDADPKATALEDVETYSQLHGMLHQWRFLTGSLGQLKSVWKAYSVGVTINENLISHTSAVFVIGPDGKFAKLYVTQMSYTSVGQMGQLLAQEASSLLPGHPPVHSHLSYSQIAGVSPAQTTTLPRAVGDGSVSLGPGRARLYVFFATWDQEITTLAGDLDALDKYQSAAKAKGLPDLTGVDEGSLEPSSSALGQFLATLPKPLSYPVAVDETGRVADGYAVQGQPWFVLVSPSGKILWSWEVSTQGWPSNSVLSSHVHDALARSN